jgi:hypothetical protein
MPASKPVHDSVMTLTKRKQVSVRLLADVAVTEMMENDPTPRPTVEADARMC